MAISFWRVWDLETRSTARTKAMHDHLRDGMENPYIGILSYLALPALFFAGCC
jgi:hypothetical protein